MRALLLFAAAAFPLTACRGQAPLDSGVRRALFIGNSYLYSRDVPGMVQALAQAAGEQLEVTTIAEPDLALIDHWNQGAVQREIARGGWTWVVLQQGPSSVEANRDTLRLATRLFAGEIARAHGRPALFSAWPSEDRRQDFPRAIESYTIAANDVNGILLPVASAWLAAWTRDPNLRLYDDGLHPSAEGAYLSALVVYARLLDKSPIGVTSPSTITPATARLLQDAAAEATAH